MAKIICRSCGKIISDVDAFCPKCGAPAEVSMRPATIGGRSMAAAGISVSKGRNSRRNLAAAGRSASDTEKTTDSLDHAHSSFESICSEDEGSVRREELRDSAEKARAAFREKRARSAGAGRKAGAQGSGKKTLAIIVAVVIGISLLSDLLGGIYNEFEVAFEGTYYEEAEPDWQAEMYAVTGSGDAFLYQMADQIAYRSYVEQSDSIAQMSQEEYQDFYRDRIAAEIAELEPYIGDSLGGSSIEENCGLYYDGLVLQQESLQYAESDPAHYEELWNTGRAMISKSVTELFAAGLLDITWEQYQPYEEFMTAEATAEV
ncbi:MAG: zinc ribbon domain-containing protein [Anaerovoracaceae bacterium]